MSSPDQLYHRPDFVREVFVFLQESEELIGFTRDISKQGASIFIKLSQPLEDKSASVFYDYKLKLLHQTIQVSVKPWEAQEHFPLKINQVELSWQKGYDIFITGEFLPMSDLLSKKLKDICPCPIVREVPFSNYKSIKLEAFKNELSEAITESINIEVQSSYSNVCATRDYIASISTRHKFTAETTYYIKLMADELLMNAFLYGTPKQGIPTTKIHIEISRHGFLFEISDSAGRPFNDEPYRKKSLKNNSGGLAIINAFSEDWEVNTEPEVSTKVSFFMNRIEEPHEA